MEAKTVKVGNKYYKEGVEVDAPVQKKPVSEGLAASGASVKKKKPSVLDGLKQRRERFSGAGLSQMLFGK